MHNKELSAQNATLTALLKQAGLDAQARDVAERVQRVLTDEIHHRMKNMLAMVTAIVRQSLRSAANMAEAEAAIGVRLLAMARAHDLLLKADWKTAGLRDVIAGAIQQHDTLEGRIALEGENLQIDSAMILPLTLALNELCTNAIKYGALSKDAGQVSILWTAADGALTLCWRERGGPAVAPPSRKSFGMRLLEEALPRQIGGTGRLSFAPEGAEFELVVPLERLTPQEIAQEIVPEATTEIAKEAVDV